MEDHRRRAPPNSRGPGGPGPSLGSSSLGGSTRRPAVPRGADLAGPHPKDGRPAGGPEPRAPPPPQHLATSGPGGGGSGPPPPRKGGVRVRPRVQLRMHAGLKPAIARYSKLHARASGKLTAPKKRVCFSERVEVAVWDPDEDGAAPQGGNAAAASASSTSASEGKSRGSFLRKVFTSAAGTIIDGAGTITGTLKDGAGAITGTLKDGAGAITGTVGSMHDSIHSTVFGNRPKKALPKDLETKFVRRTKGKKGKEGKESEKRKTSADADVGYSSDGTSVARKVNGKKKLDDTGGAVQVGGAGRGAHARSQSVGQRPDADKLLSSGSRRTMNAPLGVVKPSAQQGSSSSSAGTARGKSVPAGPADGEGGEQQHGKQRRAVSVGGRFAEEEGGSEEEEDSDSDSDSDDDEDWDEKDKIVDADIEEEEGDEWYAGDSDTTAVARAIGPADEDMYGSGSWASTPVEGIERFMEGDGCAAEDAQRAPPVPNPLLGEDRKSVV